jgi:hypothetical protein
MGSSPGARTPDALKGTTAQRLPVTLTAVQFLPAKHYWGRAIHFKARLTCTENGIPSQMTAGPFIVDIKPDRLGRFRSSAAFEADDFPTHASVSGQIRNHQASGTLRITTTLYASSVPSGIPCHSGRVTWTASRAAQRCDENRLRRSNPAGAVPIAASIFLDMLSDEFDSSTRITSTSASACR